MPKEPKQQDRDEQVEPEVAARETNDVPLTLGQLAKWIGMAFTVVTVVISAVWFVASAKSDQLLLKQEVVQLEGKIVDVDKISLQRNDAQEKEIQELARRTDNTERSVQEMGRKLDVAVAILERIEKSIDQKANK